MTPPRHNHRLPVLLSVAFALMLPVVGASVARGETASTPGTTTTTTAPAPEVPVGVHGQVGEPAAETETAPAPEASSTNPRVTTETTPTTPTTPAPEVRSQSPQTQSAPGEASGHSERTSSHTHRRNRASGMAGKGNTTPGKTTTG